MVEREQMFLLLICRASTKQLSPRIFPQCPYITTHSSYFKILTAAFPVPGSRFPVLHPTIFWNTLSNRHKKEKRKKKGAERAKKEETGEKKMLTLLIMIIPAALKSRNALLIYGMYL